MRDKNDTRYFYVNTPGFREFGKGDYPGCLMPEKDGILIHFFEFRNWTQKRTSGKAPESSPDRVSKDQVNGNIKQDVSWQAAKNV